jgi:hypothetical protein
MAVQIQSAVGQYSFTGMADMYSIFSQAYRDKVAVHHIYQDPFPNHSIPDRKTCSSTTQHLRKRQIFMFTAAE